MVEKNYFVRGLGFTKPLFYNLILAHGSFVTSDESLDLEIHTTLLQSFVTQMIKSV